MYRDGKRKSAILIKENDKDAPRSLRMNEIFRVYMIRKMTKMSQAAEQAIWFSNEQLHPYMTSMGQGSVNSASGRREQLV